MYFNTEDYFFYNFTWHVVMIENESAGGIVSLKTSIWK